MANLPEKEEWEDVYQWETSDRALGGPGGVMNKPLLNLTNRTAFLKKVLADNTGAATTDKAGIVKLNSAINSTSITEAATPSAVKEAYDLAASKLSSLPDATTKQKGIVQLSSATDSDSETVAATPKAVKAISNKADSILAEANRKVASVNGQEGVVNLLASDVDAVSATAGGTFRQPIAAKYNDDLYFANQYFTTAPFWNEFSTTSTSEYRPLIKQKSTLANKNSYAFSLGTLITGTDLDFVLHMKGSGGQEKIYRFNTARGDFVAPGNVTSSTGSIVAEKGWVYAGSAQFQNNGNLVGSIWGGALSEYLYCNFTTAIRRGSQQYVKPADWTTHYEVPDGYITGFHNETSDGNLRFCGWYFRVPLYRLNGTWVNAGNY